MGTYLAIDIGGTAVKSAYFDAEQKMYGHTQEKTNDNIHYPIVDQVKQIVDRAISEEAIAGVGISSAGIVDRQNGKIVYAGPTIPHYTGTAWKKTLTKAYGFPVVVENDVNAALLGEIWKGAGRGKNHLFCITLGTGIGGAYYDHHIIDGAHFQANAAGYLLYDEKTNTTYEQRASTAALNQRIQQHYPDAPSAAAIFSYAKEGDSECLALIEEWAAEVAKGLAQIILIRDPSCIIIGGGISDQGDFLLECIQNKVDAFLPPDFRKTELQMAQLTNNAALYGAIYPFFKK